MVLPSEKINADGIRKRVKAAPPPSLKLEKKKSGFDDGKKSMLIEKFFRPKEEAGIIITEPPEVEHNDRDEESFSENKTTKVGLPEKSVFEDTSRDFYKKSVGASGPNRFWKWAVIFGFAALAVILILASTVFAKFRVAIEPRIESIEFKDLVVAADISVIKVLASQKVVPAERLEFSRGATGEFDSTEQEFIEEKSRGRAEIYNRFSSAPQTLVASTRFVTDSGLTFRLPKTTMIPGAKIEEGKIVPQYIETELLADTPGEGSNIPGEAELKIPGFKGTAKYEGFYALAKTGFSGGFKGTVKVVSKDDLKKAHEEVTKKTYDELRQELQRKIPPDFKFLEALREIEISKIDAPGEKTRRDRFSVEVTALGKVLVFREEDVLEIFRDLFLKEGKPKELVKDSIDLRYRTDKIDWEKGKAQLVISGAVKTRYVIPREELAELLKGKKEGTIIEMLKNREEISAFRVHFFPPWRSKAPNDAWRIKIVDR